MWLIYQDHGQEGALHMLSAVRLRKWGHKDSDTHETAPDAAVRTICRCSISFIMLYRPFPPRHPRRLLLDAEAKSRARAKPPHLTPLHTVASVHLSNSPRCRSRGAGSVKTMQTAVGVRTVRP